MRREWTWNVSLTLRGGQAHVEWALADLQHLYGARLQVVEEPHPAGVEFAWQARVELEGPAPGPGSEELRRLAGLFLGEEAAPRKEDRAGDRCGRATKRSRR